MQTATNSNLILTDWSSFVDLTRHIGYRPRNQLKLPRSLVLNAVSRGRLSDDAFTLLQSVADHVYTYRDFDALQLVSRFLRSSGCLQHQNAGLYYHALCLSKAGRMREGRVILELLTERAVDRYKARAFMSLGGFAHTTGDFGVARAHYKEAGHAGLNDQQPDPLLLYQVARMVPVLKGEEGAHKSSVRALENIPSVVRVAAAAYPPLYYDYLNSLAVELMEVGRLEEARNASRIVVASPCAPAYSEWLETHDAIRSRERTSSRSRVAIGRAVAVMDFDARNVTRLPIDSYHSTTAPAQPGSESRSGRLLDFLEWKEKMPKKPDKPGSPQLKQLTTADKLLKLMDLLSKDEIDDETITEILEAAEDIVLKRKGKV